MPQLSRAQLILIESALGAVLGGLALGGTWLIVGIAGGAVFFVLGSVPIRRRWLYQLVLSSAGLLRRRRYATRHPGLAGLLGDYQVESVSGGGRGSSMGVVRCGTTWSLPLLLGLDDVLNNDASVPINLLTGLLQVEDVALSSVRLLTLITPARVPSHAPSGPVAPLSPLAVRYCLLTLDTRRATEAVAERGGTQAAIHQILRRCAVHTEQLLSTAGLSVRRLDESAVATLFGMWMGPASASTGRRALQTVETWRDVQVAGTWSSVFAVTGTGTDVADRVSRLAAAAPTPVVATALLLQRAGARGEVEATMLVRLSAPDSAPNGDAVNSLALLARAFDLVMQRLNGEQGRLLRVTTPIGVGEPG